MSQHQYFGHLGEPKGEPITTPVKPIPGRTGWGIVPGRTTGPILEWFSQKSSPWDYTISTKRTVKLRKLSGKITSFWNWKCRKCYTNRSYYQWQAAYLEADHHARHEH